MESLCQKVASGLFGIQEIFSFGLDVRNFMGHVKAQADFTIRLYFIKKEFLTCLLSLD
jgi:hypothetical protein